ncbi:MAG: KH domain-containing protein [Clostridiales bacterium]|nr:KH domain-containing protein [Clostridiales bacterium]
MTELVEFLVKEIVDEKDKVCVTLAEENVINISVSKEDMGKVIGKQGRIVKAIRSIVKAASVKENKRYTVEVLEAE